MAFSYKEEKLVEKLYRETGGNAAEITRRLNEGGIIIGVDRVRAFLKATGYDLQHGGRRSSKNGRGALDEEEITIVLAAYIRYKGCTACAEKGQNYMHSKTTYRNYWKAEGFSVPKNSHRLGGLEIKIARDKIAIRRKA